MQDKRPLRKSGVLARKVGDEWLLYDSEKSRVHVINASAERVWRLCDGSHPVTGICRHIQDACVVPGEADLAGDVAKILQEFSSLEILMY